MPPCSGRATCSWSNAVLGLGLLAIRRWPDGARDALLVLCLRVPGGGGRAAAGAAVVRRARRSRPSSTRTARPRTPPPTAAARPRRGARDRARLRLGLHLAARPVSYAAFDVQMATGILLGYLVGLQRAGSSGCRACASRSAGRSSPPSAWPRGRRAVAGLRLRGTSSTGRLLRPLARTAAGPR